MPETVKHAALRWTLALLIAGVGLFFAMQVKLGENALDLLPGEAVRGDLELLQQMGMVDRVFISLEFVQPDHPLSPDQVLAKLTKSAEAIGRGLAASPFFNKVVYRLPEGYEYLFLDQLMPSLPALLTAEELAEVASQLEGEGLRRTLLEDFSLLNSLAGLPLKDHIRRDPLGLARFLLTRVQGLQGEFAVRLENGFFVSRDGKNCLVWAESTKALTDSYQAEEVKDEIDTIFAQALLPGVRARLIGSLPHTLANAHTIQRDLRTLLPIATCALIALLLFALRDIRAFLVILIPFLAAPPAIAFLGHFMGGLSAIALGFGIVLLGIAVDFAIHMYLALVKEQGTAADILARLKRPMIMAVCTTVGVFVVLLTSDVPSHRQMALLAITGVLLAVFLTWLLVPVIVRRKEGSAARMEQGAGPLFFLMQSAGRKKVLFAVWSLLLATGACAWSQLSFTGDLRTLDMPAEEVVADDQHFRDTWRFQEDQAFIVVSGPDLAQALDRNDLVYKSLAAHGISGVQSLAGIMPGPVSQARNIAGWRAFWAEQGDDFEMRLAALSEAVGFAQGAFSPFLEFLKKLPTPVEPTSLLGGPLEPMLAAMLHLPAEAGGQRDEKDTDVLVTTIVPDTEAVRAAVTDLIAAEKGVHLLSNANWRHQVETLLKKDVLRLSLMAGLLVSCITLFFFRSIRISFATLAPVLSALSAMAVFCYLTGNSLNMMHLLMGIMVIGISVDYGIFIVNACRDTGLATTIRAVSICAISTLTGFGVLAFAQHPALHSLGVTVLVGIGAAWPTALLVTPILAGESAGQLKVKSEK